MSRGIVSVFLVFGITGKVGGATARHLLKMGKQVRALVRDEAKATAWSGKGVELVKGEWQDSAATTRALDGVEGAYLMMPPTQTPSRDFREARAVVASYKEALATAAPPKLVALSSWGSEKTSGLGMITSTHLLEEPRWATCWGRDVKAHAVPREAWTDTLRHMGLPRDGTWAYEETMDAVNSGWIASGVENTERVEGTTSAKQVFAAAKSAK